MPAPATKRTGRHRFYHDVQLRGPTPQRLLLKFDPVARPRTELIDLVDKAARIEGYLQSDPLRHTVFDRFSWLPPLAIKGEVTLIQSLMADWLDQSGEYIPIAWTPRLTAQRLMTLLQHIGPVLAGRDAPWREVILDTIARQARHLRRIEKRSTERPHTRLPISMARSMAALFLPEDPSIGTPGDPALLRALAPITQGELPDEWQDTEELVRCGSQLLTLKQGFQHRRLTPPEELVEALKIVRLLVGGLLTSPGQLSVFPMGQEGDAGLIRALEPIHRPEAELVLPSLHKYRLSTDNMLVHADGHTETVAPGAFQFTAYQTPIMTSCGAPPLLATQLSQRMSQWRDALSISSAGSTLDQAETPAPMRHAMMRQATGNRLEMQAAHHGFQRMLWLSLSPHTLHGEELIPLSSGNGPLRFHLHPNVSPRVEDGHIHLDAGRAGQWKMSCQDASFGIEESIYAGQAGEVVPTQQLVLRPQKTLIRWAVAEL